MDALIRNLKKQMKFQDLERRAIHQKKKLKRRKYSLKSINFKTPISSIHRLVRSLWLLSTPRILQWNTVKTNYFLLKEFRSQLTIGIKMDIELLDSCQNIFSIMKKFPVLKKWKIWDSKKWSLRKSLMMWFWWTNWSKMIFWSALLLKITMIRIAFSTLENSMLIWWPTISSATTSMAYRKLWSKKDPQAKERKRKSSWII